MSKVVVSPHEPGQGSYASYTIGFVISLVLTMAAFIMATHHLLHGLGLVSGLLFLGVIQLFVQMVFFLHLGRDPKSKWNLVAFAFMLIVVLILVVGSLWIIDNLDYHHHALSQKQINTYLKSQDGL